MATNRHQSLAVLTLDEIILFSWCCDKSTHICIDGDYLLCDETSTSQHSEQIFKSTPPHTFPHLSRCPTVWMLADPAAH